MKILQLNMWGGRLERQIPMFLKDEQPNVLCLQEAISFEGSDEAGLFVTVESIQKQFDLPYMVMAPVFSFNYMNGVARFGNCILSRTPISKSEVIFTYLEHKEDFIFGQDNSNVRNFVHAVIEHRGEPLNIITHHGFHVHEHKNGNEETEKQMQKLYEYITELSSPVVLTGDFNLAPTSKSLQPLNSLLNNLSLEYKLKTTRNNLTHKTEVCDYIFVSRDLTVKSFAMSPEIISDHAALLAEL